MIYLILFLLCGVGSHSFPQPPTKRSLFLKEYETVAQGLPLQQFDGLQDYLNNTCNLTVPSHVPKLSYTKFDTVVLHFCMGILDSVERLRKDYQSQKFPKDSIDEFFNRSSLNIMSDLRNISSDICTNFNSIVVENKESLWMGNLRHHFNQSGKCNMSCIDETGIADQCVFIYGIHKVLHLLEVKVKSSLQTTTHVVSTDSQKSEKSEVPPVNIVVQQAEPVKNPESPNSEKSGVENSVQQQTAQNIANPPPQQKSEIFNKAFIIENGAQDSLDGVEDSDRFQIPTTASTTAKNVVKGSSTIVNQVNQPAPPKPNPEVVPPPPPKSESEPISGIGNVDIVNPPKQQQVPETDFNDNEYPGPDLEDEKDDVDIDRGDGDIAEPNSGRKKFPKNDAERMNSFGTKPVDAQEVDTEVSLMPWYLMVVFCAFLVYLSFANKKKIVAYVVEGRPSGRYGRRIGRPNTANYRKLDTNLEEAITSNCNTATSHVIY